MTKPPPEHDRFPYPTDTVVAIARDGAAVAEALRRLRSAGIPEERVDRLDGPDGAARIDPSGKAHGAKGQHQRRAQDLWGDDAANAREYADRLQHGAQLLAISVENRQQAQVAGAAVSGAGLTDVRYYSRHAVESL